MDNVGSVYCVAVANNLPQLEKESLAFLETNFDTLVRSKEVLSKWPKRLVKKTRIKLSGDPSEWSHFANWLDVLWFGHNTENDKLVNQAVSKLEPLINIENVVPVLVGAHTAGQKELRSKCVDFIVLHGTNVEEFQRMRVNATAHADTDLSSISNLSTSLRTEVTSLVKKQMSELKHTKKGKKSKKFGTKKNTCALCRRVVDKTQIKSNVALPGTFGFNKPKSICQSCVQLSTLVASEV